MKTLANCSPLEFLTQTNKIRKSVENWLSLTKVMEIRQTAPTITEEMSADEKRKALTNQARENISRMLDAILDEYPKETVDLLCLLCFIDPKDADKHTMTELLGSINELMGNEEIMSFFASLTQLVRTSGSTAARQ